MCIELSGPDFLDKLADTESGFGFDINAHEYRKRAAEWRELERRESEAAMLVEQQAIEISALRDRAQRATAALA
jgi:hypothetical protein